MPGAPVGAVVSINPYDLEIGDAEPERGDYLVGCSRATEEPTGSAYVVLESHRVNSAVHPHRFRLVCLKIRPEQIPPRGRRFDIYWYGRGPRRPRE